MRASFFLVVVLAGCAAAEAKPDDPLAAKVAAIKARMHVRYAAAGEIRAAIAFGELDRAKSLARTIATLDEPDVLPEWKPTFADVGAGAARVADAKDLVAAATALGDLGRRCASCHELVHAKLVLAKPPAPTTDRTLASRMIEHQWAIARLWDGLVGPSTPAWEAGADALAAAPLTITADAGPAHGGTSIGDDVARVRALATRAKLPEVKTPAARARVFGDLLGTCARCHAAIRDP